MYPNCKRVKRLGKLLKSLIVELYEFAQAEFKLDKRPKDSESTVREHLTAIWEQTGIKPSELDNKEPNQYILSLLNDFYTLSSSRQCGMSLNPIQFSEIESWLRLSNRTLEMWEIEVIKKLDVIWLNIQTE